MKASGVVYIPTTEWELITGYIAEDTHCEKVAQISRDVFYEWNRLFATSRREELSVMSLTARLRNGVFGIGKQQEKGALLALTWVDKNRYYTKMTRYIAIYLDENYHVSEIKAFSHRPVFAQLSVV